MADDLRDVVADVEARGWGPVVLAGLCAGAWMALEVARTTPLGGVIACNPQLYWQPGDPVEANIVTETHVRREAERDADQAARPLRVVVVPRRARRAQPGRVVASTTSPAQGTPTLLLFAHGDDGLEYLEDRVEPRAGAGAARHGRIEVVELPGIDHGMHRAWLRHEVDRRDARVPRRDRAAGRTRHPDRRSVGQFADLDLDDRVGHAHERAPRSRAPKPGASA